jgi:hypothetical protein
LEPKRCKSVSLSAKRSVFTLVGLAHGVVTEEEEEEEEDLFVFNDTIEEKLRFP